MDFNEMEYDTVSDLTWQLTFNKLRLVEFCCTIKEEYPQLKGY